MPRMPHYEISMNIMLIFVSAQAKNERKIEDGMIFVLKVKNSRFNRIFLFDRVATKEIEKKL